MNASHSKVTDWGLSHVAVAADATILDVGCGGGRTLGKLAAMAPHGRVCGVDYSETSVAASRAHNARQIAAGRVFVSLAPVLQLPFSDRTFDLVTAVETHIWWPDLPGGLREIHRVLKPGGRLAVISEVYRGSAARTSRVAERYAQRSGMTLLDADTHRRLLTEADYADVQLFLEEQKGWICVTGRLSTSTSGPRASL
jgi:SAM-dependent methyltransferase